MRNVTSDIMLQGCMKRQAPEKGTAVSRRIKAIKAAMAGKSGYQSQWSMDLLRDELKALKA